MPAQNEAEQFSAQPADAPSRIGLSTFNATFNGMSSPVTEEDMIRMSKEAMRRGSATTSQLAQMVSTSPAKATNFDQLFGRVSSSEYINQSPKAVPAASASGFDAFFGGQATVAAPEDMTAGYTGGATCDGNIGMGGYAIDACGPGSMGFKRPQSLKDLAIPTEQRSDPSDSQDTFHDATVSPELSEDALS